jgi:preprotein translocase subunit SecG
MFGILIAILILDALVLAGAVLLQAGQGGGLAALGGGASTDSFLGGRQATTILTKASWWCGGIFLGLSLVLAGLSTRGGAPRSVIEEIQAPSPVAPAPLLDVPTQPPATPVVPDTN